MGGCHALKCFQGFGKYHAHFRGFDEFVLLMVRGFDLIKGFWGFGKFHAHFQSFLVNSILIFGAMNL